MSEKQSNRCGWAATLSRWTSPWTRGSDRDALKNNDCISGVQISHNYAVSMRQLGIAEDPSKPSPQIWSPSLIYCREMSLYGYLERGFIVTLRTDLADETNGFMRFFEKLWGASSFIDYEMLMIFRLEYGQSRLYLESVCADPHLNWMGRSRSNVGLSWIKPQRELPWSILKS